MRWRNLIGGEMDQVLKHVIKKRDRALCEVESWENWIKAYENLIEPLEPLDTLMSWTTSPQAGPAGDTDIALGEKTGLIRRNCLR
jgi:hypothetical protein